MSIVLAHRSEVGWAILLSAGFPHECTVNCVLPGSSTTGRGQLQHGVVLPGQYFLVSREQSSLLHVTFHLPADKSLLVSCQWGLFKTVSRSRQGFQRSGSEPALCHLCCVLLTKASHEGSPDSISEREKSPFDDVIKGGCRQEFVK